MIVFLKPRLTRQDAAEQSETLGGFSFIISETARRHHWSGAGCGIGNGQLRRREPR